VPPFFNGLQSAHYESGEFFCRKSKLSKVGKATVRAVLYWSAITAICHTLVVRALAQSLNNKTIQQGHYCRYA
jgi:hypothetical protein